MRKAPERKGMLKRIGFRAKVIAVLVILVVAAFALVAAFAAGFATGSLLAETGQRDACAGTGGTWDAEKGICFGQEASATPADNLVATTTYACGDGTRFAVEQLTTSTLRLVPEGGDAPRELAWSDPDGAIAIYEGGPVTLTRNGPEARYEDADRGTSVLCAVL